MPRSKNQFADALTTLSFLLKISEETDIIVETKDDPTYCHNVEMQPDDKPQFRDIKMFIANDSCPDSVNSADKRILRRQAYRFFLNSETL